MTESAEPNGSRNAERERPYALPACLDMAGCRECVGPSWRLRGLGLSDACPPWVVPSTARIPAKACLTMMSSHALSESRRGAICWRICWETSPNKSSSSTQRSVLVVGNVRDAARSWKIDSNAARRLALQGVNAEGVKS